MSDILELKPREVSDDHIARFCQPRRIYVQEGQTLDAHMRRAIPQPRAREFAIVMMSGEIIPRCDWHKIKPKRNARIQVGLLPAGRPGKIFRAILTIAIVAVATWIAGPVGVGLLGSTFAAASAAAAFTVVANLAVNALLPIPPTSQGARTETDPTYSLQGTRNQLRPRQTVEVLLGTHRYTPSLITEQYQEPIGDDIHLSFGVCVGYGNYEFSDWRLGETPLSNYEGVIISEQPLETSPPQTLLPGDFTQRDLAIDLDTSWHEERTADNVSDIDVLISFPRGLGTTNDKGDPESVSVTIDVEYREIHADGSTGDWRNVAALNGVEADDAAVQAGFISRNTYWAGSSSLEEYFGGLVNNNNDSALSFTSRRSDVKPFARRIRFSVPPGRRYDVRVRRAVAKDTDIAVANDAAWIKLNSWSDRDLTPDPKMATAFFRLKASGELSGVVSDLNVIAKKIIPTFNGAPASFDPGLATPADWENNLTTSQNCADVLLDVGRGAHSLRPNSDSDYYWPSIAAFWIWCFENNFTFNLPIAQDLSRNEVEDMVAAAGRGRIFRGSDGKKRIAIDRPRLEGPTQLITPKNARNFSFTRTFSAPVHGLRIPFTNAETGYQDDELTVFAEGYDEETATEFQDITAPGQVYPEGVYETGDYYLTSAQLLSTVASFEMDIEGGTLELGEYVHLAHPILNSVSVSTRLRSVVGKSVRLEDPVNFIAGESYVLRYRKVYENEEGEALIEAEGFVPLINDGLKTDIITLGDDLPLGAELETGDLAVIGIAGEETFEGLVKNIDRVGPRQFDIELVAYLPERLTRRPVPVRAPLSLSNWITPPTPLLTGAETSRDHISIGFELPDGYQRAIANFRTRYWEMADDNQEVSAVTGPILEANSRNFTFAPGIPSRSYAAEITAIDYDGRASTPLTVLNLVAASAVPIPQNASALPLTLSNASGVQIPAIAVSVDAVNPIIIETLIIETRRSGETLWSSTTTAPADTPRKTLTGLTPGENIDICLSWRDVRGAVTAQADKVILSQIAVPAVLTSNDTANVNGQPAIDVTGKIQYFDTSGRMNNGLALPPSVLAGNTFSKISGTITVNETSLTISAQVYQTPAGQVTYNSGSVTGLVEETTYFIYVDDPDFSGGTIGYGVVTDPTQITSNLSRVYIGKATTAALNGGDGGGRFDGGNNDFR